MKYYLIAGEASGDLHASNLMKALKTEDANAEFRYYGGDKMQSVGGILVKHYKEMAYMGFVPVLLHLRTILRNMDACKKDIVAWKPDVVILVDYPGFNLKIAKFIRKNNRIPVYYYIAPKIWAWKEYRIKNIKSDVDELFSILPFEVDFFKKKHNYPIHYVGNPCADAISQSGIAIPAADCRKKVIAILAGSRHQEIKKNLGKMLEAASSFNGYRLIIAAAPNIDIEVYRQYIPRGIDVEIIYNKTYETVAAAEAALVTSGTATLETALLNTPQVVCYYFSLGRITKWVMSKIIKVKWVSLVNLIANRTVVTELLGNEMNVRNLRSELAKILIGGDNRNEMLKGYTDVQKAIGPAGASERAAKIIAETLPTSPKGEGSLRRNHPDVINS